MFKIFYNFPCAFFFDGLSKFILIDKYLGFPRYLTYIDFKLYYIIL